MTEFYLFDVSHGQCASLRLPNGRWCVFDVGKNGWFSPISWMAGLGTGSLASGLGAFLSRSGFRFLKATVSHLHGDHLTDWPLLIQHGPDYLRTVNYDFDYLLDVSASSGNSALPSILRFCSARNYGFGPTRICYPDYAGVTIQELSLPVSVARALGGDANTRVNNASVVTRITCYRNSILLCGDMEASGWSFVLDSAFDCQLWRQLVANVDILVAPHHGHTSGFSPDLLRIARPKVVLASVVENDEHVDSRYSSAEFVSGVTIGNASHRCITTRQKGHIKLTIESQGPSRLGDLGLLTPLLLPGARIWTFGKPAIGMPVFPTLSSPLFNLFPGIK